MREFRFRLLIILVMVSIVGLTGCISEGIKSPTAGLDTYGIVIDNKGNYMAKAAISIEGMDVRYTNQDGVFSLDDLIDENITIRVDAAGCLSREIPLYVEGGSVTKIELQDYLEATTEIAHAFVNAGNSQVQSLGDVNLVLEDLMSLVKDPEAYSFIQYVDPSLGFGEEGKPVQTWNLYRLANEFIQFGVSMSTDTLTHMYESILDNKDSEIVYVTAETKFDNVFPDGFGELFREIGTYIVTHKMVLVEDEWKVENSEGLLVDIVTFPLNP